MAALLFLAMELGFCAPVSKMLKKADERGTPENSVLVYGKISPVSLINFLQMDSHFSSDRQDVDFLSDSVFCLMPVAPGSLYMAGYAHANISKNSYMQGYYPLNGSMWDFRAPSEPGLYYYGSYDFKKSDENGERVATKKNPKSEELQCLKILQKSLKKTSWNEVIQKRIDELKGK